MKRTAVFALLWILFLPYAIGQVVETVHTVSISGNATQKYSLLVDSKQSSIGRIWVLFTGWDGYAHIGMFDGSPVFLSRGIMIDGRKLFLRTGSAVAVVDSPSTVPRMPGDFRQSEPYLAGTEKIIDELQVTFPKARIYLVGASNGSISAVYLASRMGKRVDGVVILSGVFDRLEDLKDVRLSQPLLFVHHRKDECIPLAFSPEFTKKFHPLIIEDIGIRYSSQCGPYSAHHFHGQEADVIDAMYKWAEQISAVPPTSPE